MTTSTVEGNRWNSSRPKSRNWIDKENPNWGKSGDEKTSELEWETQRQASPPEHKRCKKELQVIKDEWNGYSVKENIKSKKILTQNTQKIWNTLERPNLRTVRMEEGEETQIKGTEMFLTKSQKKISLTWGRRYQPRYKKHKPWTGKENPLSI